jgi:L-alanine-DL-glutamate epimerase-like enolase superfamily enzyme
MEITEVEAIPLEIGVEPLEAGGIAPYVTGQGSVERSQRMLVRVETDEGVTGWGESMVEMDPIAMKTLIEREVGPKAVGRSIWQIEEFVDDYFYYYVDIESMWGPVEMAMWDALGKSLDAPLHQLLGGKCTDEVDCAYCVGILSPEESREHVHRALDGGFSVLKTKAGRDWEQDIERLIAMDDEADGRLEFRIDPNQTWSFEEAVRVGAKLEDAGVYVQYLEQPIHIETYGAYKRLRERLRQPIAANDDTYFSRNFFNLVKDDAIDVGVVDCCGSGISGVQKLAGVAEDAAVTLAHHCGFDLGVKTAAMLHSVSSTPAFTLPSDTIYYAWSDYIVEEPFDTSGGRMTVPDEPGLGVEVDESQVEALRIDG